MAKRQKTAFRPVTQIVRKITIGQISVCALLVAGMVFVNVFFSHDAVAGRSLESLAGQYYENYFYPQFLNGRTPSDELFGKYTEDGFKGITLRQLLVSNNTDGAKMESDFYFCDKQKTKVTIIPVAPFGKTDYKIETQLDCSAK